MVCKKCSANVPNTFSYCKYCGSFLKESKKICRFCNKEIDRDSLFCSFCGKDLEDIVVVSLSGGSYGKQYFEIKIDKNMGCSFKNLLEILGREIPFFKDEKVINSFKIYDSDKNILRDNKSKFEYERLNDDDMTYLLLKSNFFYIEYDS